MNKEKEDIAATATNKNSATNNPEDVTLRDGAEAMPDGEEPKSLIKMTKEMIIKAISAAKHKGDLNSHQVRSMYRNLNISQAYFTRKVPTPEERRAKRKAQKEARKKNRGTTKGQKRVAGRFCK